MDRKVCAPHWLTIYKKIMIRYCTIVDECCDNSGSCVRVREIMVTRVSLLCCQSSVWFLCPPYIPSTTVRKANRLYGVRKATKAKGLPMIISENIDM